jgi:hypothetical protein
MSDNTEIKGEVLETTEEKPGRAKTLSLIGQIIMALWIAGWSAYKFITNPTGIQIDDIIFSGVGIASSFSPVYVSIIMDKIKEIRFGGK